MQTEVVYPAASTAVSLCVHMFMFDISQMGGGGMGDGYLPELIHSEKSNQLLNVFF